MPEVSDIRQQFLAGMSFAASTVNVVTTDGVAGRCGVTVSAMSSVSADGDCPTLLVCVHEASAAAAAIIRNKVFCVNVLREDQSRISDSFAGRLGSPGYDKFACASWAIGKTGAPRVIDPLVAFDCRLSAEHRVGTHHILIGSIAEVFLSESGGSPLIYSNRNYRRAAELVI
jgi:flavin reductase (DIM6/NTAB) family NADH-FMN oxidoreductase RutF